MAVTTSHFALPLGNYVITGTKPFAVVKTDGLTGCARIASADGTLASVQTPNGFGPVWAQTNDALSDINAVVVAANAAVS